MASGASRDLIRNAKLLPASQDPEGHLDDRFHDVSELGDESMQGPEELVMVSGDAREPEDANLDIWILKRVSQHCAQPKDFSCFRVQDFPMCSVSA